MITIRQDFSLYKNSPSVFRYPGGKIWITPIIKFWIETNKYENYTIIEPFGGSAVVSLFCVKNGLAKSASFYEIDEQIAAVWKTILGEDHTWLIQNISSFNLDVKSVDEVLTKSAEDNKYLAFQTILKNRINRSGILTNGAGRINRGENNKGLRSRWYPSTISRRIKEIHEIKDSLNFIQEDGINAIDKINSLSEQTLLYIDPPYIDIGKRLYKHHDVDHKRLFQLASEITHPFLMSYNDSEQVRTLVTEFGLKSVQIRMKNSHNTDKIELIISNNLNWIHDYSC
ncbi:DNA adenine methylase [Dyadobacter alkalitolerans]|uniref:DNA adenine methylase n=1 Tax=Dyadobacter alkalitolerans TaxID=492736 RepID=UPI0003FCB27F|nr:DNA adenine methylase [Dyadobacter alkalitolerans]